MLWSSHRCVGTSFGQTPVSFLCVGFVCFSGTFSGKSVLGNDLPPTWVICPWILFTWLGESTEYKILSDVSEWVQPNNFLNWKTEHFQVQALGCGVPFHTPSKVLALLPSSIGHWKHTCSILPRLACTILSKRDRLCAGLSWLNATGFA